MVVVMGNTPDNATGAYAAHGRHSPQAAELQPETLLLQRSINHVSLLNAVFRKGETTICVLDICLALLDAFPKPLLEGEWKVVNIIIIIFFLRP